MLDVILVVAGAAAVLILVTGGADGEIGGVAVQARRARNPLLAAFAVAALRYPLLRHHPLLGRIDLASLTRASERWAEQLGTRLQALDARTTSTIVLTVAALAFLVHSWNAAYYYGFFSGDDVEIHQMTFGALFGRDPGIWDIRGPFFPLGFVFPLQWLLVRAGVQATSALVVAGRLVVAGFAALTLWLVHRAAGAQLGNAVALLAVIFLATSRLQLRFGGAELPGPVAAAFLVAAFALLGTPGPARAAAAGLAMAVAASLRFSEGFFLAPLVVQLGWQRRFRDLAAALAAFALSAAAILGLGDALYWGEPFHSLRAQLGFTLIARASSSGAQPFQPWHFYLTHSAEWTSVFLLGFAVVSMRRHRDVALWTFLPVAALSLFPHKEERYLVPVLPFLALGAAAGFWELLGPQRRHANPRAALFLLYCLAGALLFGIEGFRFRRSEGGVGVARWLAREDPAATVAIEQAWRAGRDLYLPDARILDLDPDRIAERSYLWASIRRPDVRYVALRAPTVERARLRPVLSMAGFEEVPLPDGGRWDPYRLFRRYTSRPASTKGE